MPARASTAGEVKKACTCPHRAACRLQPAGQVHAAALDDTCGSVAVRSEDSRQRAHAQPRRRARPCNACHQRGAQWQAERCSETRMSFLLVYGARSISMHAPAAYMRARCNGVGNLKTVSVCRKLLKNGHRVQENFKTVSVCRNKIRHMSRVAVGANFPDV